MMRVLLTGVGGPAGRSLARQLSARGHWVAGTDLRDTGAEVDAFRRVCAVSDPAYLPTLHELVGEWSVDAVIPSISEELPLLAGQHALLPVPVLIGSPDAVGTADDKLLTAQRLQQAGVPVPRFAGPADFPSAADAVSALGGPVIVKPRVGRGGRGVRLLDVYEAAGSIAEGFWADLDEESIVQEFAPGAEYAPVLFRDIDGAFPVCTVLRKTALKDGAVGNAVSVVRVEGTEDDDVRSVARAAAEALDLHGPIDVDVRRRADGMPVVLEINARFGANSAHAPELLDAALASLSERTAAARV
ncbi:ATP-grasp domain-containing protein [Microbacterium esteraromaticum]